MTDCLFCKMANKEIEPKIAYEDDEILAFHDIAPKAPVHILIIPKRHLSDLSEMTEADIALIGRINYVATKLAAEYGIAESGYRLLTNCRADSGQEVPHLHFHLVGGEKMGCFV